jgi:hypothetical protein
MHGTKIKTDKMIYWALCKCRTVPLKYSSAVMVDALHGGLIT